MIHKHNAIYAEGPLPLAKLLTLFMQGQVYLSKRNRKQKKKVSILVFKTFGCTVQGGMEVNGNSVSYLSILSNNCMIHKNSLGNRDHNLRCSPPTHKYSVAHKYYCFCFLITLAWKKDLANSLRWIWMSFIWRLTQAYPPLQGNLW